MDGAEMGNPERCRMGGWQDSGSDVGGRIRMNVWDSLLL